MVLHHRNVFCLALLIFFAASVYNFMALVIVADKMVRSFAIRRRCYRGGRRRLGRRSIAASLIIRLDGTDDNRTL